MIDEKWLLNYIDALPENTPSQVLSRLALVNMVAAWQKEQASRTNELDTNTAKLHRDCGEFKARAVKGSPLMY